MPLQTRLLDMGRVGAVRAHSLRLALVAGVREGDGPVLLLAVTASPAIAVGEDRAGALEEVLEACRARRIPLLRLPGGADAVPIPAGSLLLTLILPAAAAARGVPADEAGCRDWLVAALAEGGAAAAADALATAGGPLTLRREAMGAALILGLQAPGDGDRDLAHLLAPTAPAAAGSQLPPGESLAGAELAEALLGALERRLDLEWVPSMPSPEELERVYAWDHRLTDWNEASASSSSRLAV